MKSEECVQRQSEAKQGGVGIIPPLFARVAREIELALYPTSPFFALVLI